MNMVAFLAIALVTVVMVRGSPDNRGTEFIIGYMQNGNLSMPVLLYVMAAKNTTVHVHVSAPRYSGIGLNENFELIRNQVKLISIDNSIRGVGTALETKGILISASDEVVVYGQNVETASNDVFLALPLDVLGKEYYIMTYYKGHPVFMIVGVVDETLITIQYSNNIGVNVEYAGKVFGPGSTQTLLIHKYDTYQAISKGDLTGTRITADKKFAVFSGNSLTRVNPYDPKIGSKDAIVDQMPPVLTWGKEFAIVPTPHRTVGDVVRFVGSENSTNVVLLCGGLNAEPTDPSLITIPPMEQYAADYKFYTPSNSDGGSQNFLVFVVRESELSGLRLDEGPLPLDTVCTTIPNTTYCGGFVSVTKGDHTIRHTSPISVFGGYIYGTGNHESYGMPLGLRLAPINLPCIRTMSVTGDGIDNDCDGNVDEEICTVSPYVDDDNDGFIDEDCAKPVPINGEWGAWGAWIDAMCYCIERSTTGNQPRRRYCDSPSPQYDGFFCLTGSDTEYQTCTLSGDAASNCSIDGGYSDWSAWSACTVTCGEGITQRTRTCTNPSPANGGRDCSLLGVDSNSQSCHNGVDCEDVIVRDGAWGAWGSWLACTVTCGTGQTSRTRNCANPTPSNGRDCDGEAMEFVKCNTQECAPINTNIGQQSEKLSKDLVCPKFSYPCKSDWFMCIENFRLCDCRRDCADGSDESVTWVGCITECPTSTIPPTSPRAGSQESDANALFTMTSLHLVLLMHLFALLLLLNK